MISIDGRSLQHVLEGWKGLLLARWSACHSLPPHADMHSERWMPLNYRFEAWHVHCLHLEDALWQSPEDMRQWLEVVYLMPCFDNCPFKSKAQTLLFVFKICGWVNKIWLFAIGYHHRSVVMKDRRVHILLESNWRLSKHRVQHSRSFHTFRTQRKELQSIGLAFGLKTAVALLILARTRDLWFSFRSLWSKP